MSCVKIFSDLFRKDAKRAFKITYFIQSGMSFLWHPLSQQEYLKQERIFRSKFQYLHPSQKRKGFQVQIFRFRSCVILSPPLGGVGLFLGGMVEKNSFSGV